MGTCSSSAEKAPDPAAGNKAKNSKQLVALQSKIQNKMDISLELQVAHFSPSSFPLSPIISKRTSKLCIESWLKIVNYKEVDETGFTTSGITFFYQDFYERLRMIDSKGEFEAILTRHASEENAVAVKGAILVRIIKFVVQIVENSAIVQMMLFMLGKSHQQRGIRPWQYSIFIQTLLNSISSQLGTDATNEVMEAWVNLFAFVLQSMLPPAIDGMSVETEFNVNTSSEFDGGVVGDQIRKVEVQKRLQKASERASNGRSRGNFSSRMENMMSKRSSTSSVGSSKRLPRSHKDFNSCLDELEE